MKILLISGHKKNWVAGASGVDFYLNQELEQLAFPSHMEKLINDFKRNLSYKQA
jgi:hypothetical protein